MTSSLNPGGKFSVLVVVAGGPRRGAWGGGWNEEFNSGFKRQVSKTMAEALLAKFKEAMSKPTPDIASASKLLSQLKVTSPLLTSAGSVPDIFLKTLLDLDR